jgi:hypothetical protein
VGRASPNGHRSIVFSIIIDSKYSRESAAQIERRDQGLSVALASRVYSWVRLRIS